MTFFFDIIDDLREVVSSMSFSRILGVLWFLFILEIPRYHLLDIIVLFKRWMFKKSLYRQDVIARAKLRLDNPFISIIVPGKNEGEHIYKLTRSLREQTYQNFELVIVDDGSDDDTALICRSLLKNGLIQRFFCARERGGKASAANLALVNSKAKIVVHLDADSSLDVNAIEELLIPFYWGKNVGAVGGNVKVRNTYDSFCTASQALEYLKTIMVGRIVLADIHMLRIISGAFGAFRMDVLKQVGNWDIGPGLDGDITQKIRKSGYHVAFTHKSVCLTNAPVKFSVLFKQRLRWSKSLTRFRLRKHANVFNPTWANFSILNFLANADNVLFNFLFDFVWMTYMIVLIVTNWGIIFELFLLKFVIMGMFSLASFAIIMIMTERRREEFPLIIYTPFQSLYSGLFMRITRIIASYKELFFFSSYKDKWNPEKSSRQARYEGM